MSRFGEFFSLEHLNNRYPALHGLRVVAIVLVVQLHLTSTAFHRGYLGPQGFYKHSLGLWYGMDFFFVLSGFLIGSMLWYSMAEMKKVLFLRFYARRALRIFPLYYVALVLIASLPQPVGGFPHHEGILWQEWVYLTNYPGHLNYVMYWSWSLSVEEQFYLAVPLVVYGFSRLKGDWPKLCGMALLWLSCLGIKCYYLTTSQFTGWSWIAEVYFPTHTRFDTLVAGMVAAYLHQEWPQALRRHFRQPWTWYLAVGSVLVLGYLTTQFSFLSQLQNIDPPPQNFFLKGSLLMGTCTSPVLAYLVLWAVYSEGRLTKLLGHRIFLNLATLGYAVYLIHIPVLEHFVLPYFFAGCSAAHPPTPAVWSVSLLTVMVLSTAVAYLMHLVLEKPILRLRQRMVP